VGGKKSIIMKYSGNKKSASARVGDEGKGFLG